MPEIIYKNKFHQLLDNLDQIILQHNLSREFGIPYVHGLSDSQSGVFGELLEYTTAFFIENTPEILKQFELNISNHEHEFHADVKYKGLAVRAFAINMMDFFKDNNGENFVTVDFGDPDNKFEKYSVTMQKHVDPEFTPAERIAQLEMENSALKKRLNGDDLDNEIMEFIG